MAYYLSCASADSALRSCFNNCTDHAGIYNCSIYTNATTSGFPQYDCAKKTGSVVCSSNVQFATSSSMRPRIKVPYLLAALFLLIGHALAAGNSTLSPTESCGGGNRQHTDLVGDGNPHQNYKFTQLSGNVDCDGGQCSISSGFSDTKSYEFGISSGGGPWGFSTFNFGVSRSHTISQSITCQQSGKHRACVWSQMDYTAYTARTIVEPNDCGIGGKSSDPYVIFAPNNAQCGVQFHCRYDSDCSYQGDSYWIKCGPAGGNACNFPKSGGYGPDGFGDIYWKLPRGC